MKIDKGIPLPPGRKVWKWWKVLSSMEPTDSFLLNSKQSVRSAGSEICTTAKKFNLGKFSLRKTEQGVRVWRIE